MLVLHIRQADLSLRDVATQVGGKQYATWKSRSVDARSRIGMPHLSKPWTGLATTKAAGIPRTCRYLDALDISFELHKRKLGLTDRADPKEIAAGLWCNPSQSVGHACKPVLGGPSTFCRSSIWYSFEADVILCGFG